MANKTITEQQILTELHKLSPTHWADVLKYIAFLKYQSQFELPQKNFTARDLLQSELVGLWADRSDIGDSLSYARQLRQM